MRAAIITARGGSKRLPRKNVRDFHGRPIIVHAIRTAMNTGLFDTVIVSTDDAEISLVATAFGAEAPFQRPPELADDHASTAQVMKHAVNWLLERARHYEHVCCIYPCTPLMRATDLIDGHQLLERTGKCYAFPVAQYAPAMQRALRVEPDGRVQSVWPNFDGVRTQDLEPRYYDAGQWYWGTAEAWLNEIPIYGSWSVAMPIQRWRAIDIDTEDDWLIAEAVYRAQFTDETMREPG